MKKLLTLSLFLAFLFAFTSPTSASAATYVTAKDSDFSGSKNGDFRYAGTADYVRIPNTIKGVAVTNYDFLFANTPYIKGVISDNPNIVSTVGMFTNNSSATLDIDIVTANVKTMQSMFSNTKTKTINFSDRFDVGKVENMAFMFAWTDLSTIDITGFSTNNLKNTYCMFQESKAKTVKFSNKFTTDKVTQMAGMFYKADVTELDLSSLKINIGTCTDFMFEDSKITTGYARSKADVEMLNNSSYIKPGLKFQVK